MQVVGGTPGGFKPRTTAVLWLMCLLSINVLFNSTVSFHFSVPEIIDGNTLTATVVDLNAWVEYEFRVLARNSVGVGEPSPVSVRTRTEDASTHQQAGCCYRR